MYRRRLADLARPCAQRRWRRAQLAISGSLLALALTGCVHGKPLSALENPSSFPTRQELERIAATEPAAPGEQEPVVPVERWTIGAPDGDEPAPEQAPWLDALDETIATRKPAPRRTDEMVCVAREIGRFLLDHGGLPDERVRTLIQGHCGAALAAAHHLYEIAEISPEAAPAQLLEQWAPGLEAELSQSLEGRAGGPGQLLVGRWFGQKEGRAVVMTVVGLSLVRLREVSASGLDARRIRIRGRLLTSAAHVQGWINQGEYGVERCTIDARVAMPSFSMSCPLAAGDQQAWVNIGWTKEARLLTEGVARLLVKDGKAIPTHFEPTTASLPPARDAADFRRRTVTKLNDVRKKKGVAPVRLAARQSALNQKLTRHFWAAASTGDGKTQDSIALGLLAGHDVGATIGNAHFLSTAIGGERVPEAWLEHCLDQPIGRDTLLDPEVRSVAFGVSLDHPRPGMHVVGTSYEPLDARSDEAVAQEAIARLKAARSALGYTTDVMQAASAIVREEAARISVEQIHPDVTMNRAMRRAARRQTVPVHGMWIAGYQLADSLASNPDLLRAPHLRVAVAVTHVRLPGSPWGLRIAIVLLVPSRATRA
ncbi:MAG: hypothetical protein JRI23_07465 [Deltaproteobacteria bacterium]|jgi:hypothetical protein|nr:hypothetical protein [Deltaproteobacteria bacterium]MBW2531431.1 hypothetical protein [Deltaproteobacteria bacterium]